MSIPLILKVRPGEKSEFECLPSSVISFQEKQYKFSAIYQNDIPEASIDKLTLSSSALVLIGPTGSGKTTTLKSILRRKIDLLKDNTFTVCEVKENRQLIDLLDNGVCKKYLASIPLEKQLKKHKLTTSAIEKVFEVRQTSSTDSNAESSRSCLIVNLHEKSHTTTIVDMMGNEKFSQSGSTSNTFANTNVSSITQLLLSKTTRTRSSNLVTNLIFNRPTLTKVKFILHLQQSGSPDLIKSSLYNIVDVIKNFRVAEPKVSTREPGQLPAVPNYARPTAASISPRKRTAYKIVKPLRTGSSPTQSKAPKTSTGTRGFSTPLRLNNRGGPRVRATGSQVLNKVTQSLYEEQLKRLRESNKTLEDTTKKQELELEELGKKHADEISEIKSKASSIRIDGLNPLTQHLSSIRQNFDQLVSTHTSLKHKLEEKHEALNSAESTVKQRDQESSEIQSQLLQLKEDYAKLQDNHSSELKMLQGKLESKAGLVSDLQTDLDSKSGDLQKLDLLLAQTRQLLHDTQTALEEKSQIMMVIESDLQHKEHMLSESSAANDIKDKTIESIKTEAASMKAEKEKMMEMFSGIEQELREYQTMLSEKERDIDTEVTKAQTAENLLAESRKAEHSLTNKINQISRTLEETNSEKEDFARKHAELVSYNKYIVEKYTGVLQENEKMKQELADINGEQGQLSQTMRAVEELRAQLANKSDELEKMQQFREWTNIDSTETDLREKISDMESQHKQEMAEIRRANEELRQRLIQAEASPKKPFNANEIFDDSTRKDMLKLIKKSIKSSSPNTKANVLRESNIFSSDKKKSKRRASSYHTAIKSPKQQMRA